MRQIFFGPEKPAQEKSSLYTYNLLSEFKSILRHNVFFGGKYTHLHSKQAEEAKKREFNERHGILMLTSLTKL